MMYGGIDLHSNNSVVAVIARSERIVPTFIGRGAPVDI
jgi:hypothetical protein